MSIPAPAEIAFDPSGGFLLLTNIVGSEDVV